MNKQRENLLKLTCMLMIVGGVLMTPLCVLFVNQGAVSTEFPNAGIGCFAALIMNAVMAVLGVLGLIFHKGRGLKAVRILVMILLAAMIVDLFLLGAFAVIVSIPVLLLCSLFTVFSKERKVA